MQNKTITNHQLFTLTAIASVGGSILIVSATLASVARQDAWMSALIAIPFGLLVMLMFHFLGSRYPGHTLIGISKKIFGKWLGFVISAFYVLLFIKASMDVPWYIGSYFGRIMHETPAYFINIFFLAAVVIAVLYGIEVIARASEICFLIVSILFTLSILLLTKGIKIVYITPVLENGVEPVLSGSFFLLCYIAFSVVMIMMIYPVNLSDPAKAKKAMLRGFSWSGGLSFVTITMSTLVLGSAVTASSSFPALLLFQEINLGPLLTRMEYVVLLIWLISHFMVSVLFFYASVKSLAELIGLKNHQKIVIPLALLVLIASKIVLPNSIYQAKWSAFVYAPMITTLGFVFPFIMIIVYGIKKKFFNIK